MRRDVEVVIDQDMIADVRPARSSGEAIVMPGQILLPSFISGHTHSCAGTLVRGYIEEASSASILGRGNARRARSIQIPMLLIDDLNDEEMDDLTAFNLAEMLRTGCTTQIEMSLSLRQARSYVRVATRFGMRGFPGGQLPRTELLLALWGRRDDCLLTELEPQLLREISENLAFARSINGGANGRFYPMMAPSIASVHTGEAQRET